MKDYFSERLRRLTPVFIGSPEGLPPPDPDQVVDFTNELLSVGTPVFRVLYRFLILVLQALCLLKRRRSIYSLSREDADDFLQSLYSSRSAALYVIPRLLVLPVYMAYYGSDELQTSLGFDVDALREEAAKREVTR